MYRIEDVSSIFTLVVFAVIVIKSAVWAYKRPDKAIKATCLITIIAMVFIAIAIS